MVVVERADNNSALLRLPLQTTTSPSSNSTLELELKSRTLTTQNLSTSLSHNRFSLYVQKCVICLCFVDF